MVSTKEILYVLLITLAATNCFGGDENNMGMPYGCLLPLLLLLLLSTDKPCCCGDGCGGICPAPSPCCTPPICPGRRFGGGFPGFGLGLGGIL